jgi:hypothetical protein
MCIIIFCHLCHLYLMCNLIFQHLAASVSPLVTEPAFGCTMLHIGTFISTDLLLPPAASFIRQW